MYTYICIYIPVCVCTYIYTHTHIYVCIYIYLNTPSIQAEVEQNLVEVVVLVAFGLDFVLKIVTMGIFCPLGLGSVWVSFYKCNISIHSHLLYV